MQRVWNKVMLIATLAVFVTNLQQSCAAKRCKGPLPGKMTQIGRYISELDYFGGTSSVRLSESSRYNASCFWKLTFEDDVSKKKVTMYLSPDQRYMASDIMDLNIDPLAERRQREEELVQTLTAGSPPSRGSANPQVTIVEFADFECPYCKRLADAIDQMQSQNSRDVRVIFRNFPLRMHPWAREAAEIAQCAASQKESTFWSLYGFFFSNQQTLNYASIKDKAVAFARANTDLDIPKFSECVDGHLSSQAVGSDLALGRSNGVHATPTMFVNGIKYEGVRDLEQLQNIVAAAARGDVRPVTTSVLESALPNNAVDEAAKSNERQKAQAPMR